MCESPDQAFPPGLVELSQLARELPEGLPTLGRGFRRHQIDNRLGLGEIELAMLEGALTEFTGFRQSKSGQAPQIGQYCIQYRSAAVHVQLRHILAGIAPGPSKPRDQPVIQDLGASGVAESGV